MLVQFTTLHEEGKQATKIAPSSGVGLYQQHKVQSVVDLVAFVEEPSGGKVSRGPQGQPQRGVCALEGGLGATTAAHVSLAPPAWSAANGAQGCGQQHKVQGRRLVSLQPTSACKFPASIESSTKCRMPSPNP